MDKPKMILFDYGETLAFEKPFDSLRASQAILDNAAFVPPGLTAAEVAAVSDAAFAKTQAARSVDMEVHNHQLLRYELDILGIEMNIRLHELEVLTHDAAAPGWAADGAADMLGRLGGMGIRPGVISNILWSGHALKARIDSLLPDNRFEFVVASSEYGFRKPGPELFALALRVAGIEPREAWYCGNSACFDLHGARAAGVYPVWYRPDERDGQSPPGFPHTRVADWSELAALVEGCD